MITVPVNGVCVGVDGPDVRGGSVWVVSTIVVGWMVVGTTVEGGSVIGSQPFIHLSRTTAMNSQRSSCGSKYVPGEQEN